MKQATHFIEVIRLSKDLENKNKYSQPTPMRLFTWSMEVNRNHAFEVIAIFKVYPK